MLHVFYSAIMILGFLIKPSKLLTILAFLTENYFFKKKKDMFSFILLVYFTVRQKL